MRVLIVDDDVDSVADIIGSLNNHLIMDAAYSGTEGAYMTTMKGT